MRRSLSIAIGLVVVGLWCLAGGERPVKAQFNGCQAGFCAPFVAAAGGYVGPGDIVSGAIAWWGLRAYSAAYASGNGKIVQLSRTSDSQSCDFLSLSNGNLGNSGTCSGGFSGSFTSFCTSTTCTVLTLYDQSGGNNCASAACNLTNHSGNHVGFALSCFGSLPCMQSNSGNVTYLENTSAPTDSQPITLTLVAERTSNFTTQEGGIFFGGGGVSFDEILFPNVTNQVAAYGGTSQINFTAANSVLHSLLVVLNGASGVFNVDGTVSTNQNFGSQGSHGNFSLPFDTATVLDGNFTEAGAWNVAFNSTQYGNVCHNEITYWGISGTC